ncbi:hypothetical protein O6H91_23G028100 [Diphasiastrum complanatum]|uniref:Uncharacterized protein n=1 Tax=Diphasiastrum complanatum TaxID=34168 RepID=A0ACC2A963_DIPCM|nr:hypothetical protein O6H91_23G028100 [Diphasiastrum complanatum]
MESNYAKRERDREKTQELDDRTCEINSRGASDEEEGCNPRKKLCLLKEQLALLEKSFKEHNTLNSRRRDRINERMRALQDLIPNSIKDKASMLDEAEYLKELQLQL